MSDHTTVNSSPARVPSTAVDGQVDLQLALPDGRVVTVTPGHILQMMFGTPTRTARNPRPTRPADRTRLDYDGAQRLA